MRRNQLPAIAGTAACALVLTACGGDGGGSGGGEGAEKDTISWMSVVHTPTTPETDGVIESALQDYTGMEIEFQWVPAANADEKINSALASDSLPDLVDLGNITNTTVRQAMTQGQFWEVEEYLSEFDNLSQIPPETIESAKINGTLYGVPKQKPMARYGVLVRQDWLDNLGLEVPHTIEELTEVAIAFAEDDPDGNGKDDTTGFYDREESFQLGFRSLAGYFGAGQRFELNDAGEVIPSFTTDAWKEAMEWYRSLYDKGAINKEFVTLQKQNQYDGIYQGKGGIVVTGLFEARGFYEGGLAADPDTTMEWALINDMTYDDVPRRILTDTNGGMGGWFAIPRSTVETEEELRVVLGFIDSLLDEEPFTLMTNGIEGDHFEFDDDGVVSILDQTKWEQEVQPFASSRPSDLVVTFPSAQPYVDLGNELMEENAEYVVLNPAQSLTSETFDARWSVIEQQANDAYNQYMMGQIDMDQYEATIDALGGEGLDQIVEEFTAAHAEANG
ncbi:extracellular solute-binding protein [Phytoactinopolyspora halotolerans]|uniref:Extracellular solute-binding protein n=1 Tax=Phytoactinopolyspora halotolerans TaxID=1981512 RepID=A0A6L9SJ88_9ACTN|nr:extracellular solute-binding protein [Phytoactinopolyspora halotolerans]NEE04758.1 extracellular solute-binding protein [Phytoactinopolyspora halotolerans]